MKTGNFEDLVVWQKTHSFVLQIYRLTRTYPANEKICLINQTRRAAVSIAANIAEGHRKGKRDFARYLDIAQGSLQETKYHLILSRDLTYCCDADFEILMNSADEIGKMLNGLRRSLIL